MTGLTIVDQPAAPGSPEWRRLVTASKIAGICGISPYATPYTVWHEMNGVEPPTPTQSAEDRFRTGHAMEAALAWWLADRHPEWQLSRGEVQVTRDDLGFPNAATPDRIATDRGCHRGRAHSRTVQFKTVGDYDEYRAIKDDGIIPDHWLTQICWEQHVSGLTRNPAVLVAAGPYYDWCELEVPYDAQLARVLVDRARGFVDSLDGAPPEPTAPADVRIARAAHPDIDPDADPVTIPDDLAVDWDAAKAAQKQARGEAKTADGAVDVVAARLLEAMGTAAEACTADGRVIARRVATKRGIQLRWVKPPAAS